MRDTDTQSPRNDNDTLSPMGSAYPGQVVGYGYNKRVERKVTYIGELPKTGRWVMHLIPVSATREAIVLTDQTGQHKPRVVKDGALTILEAA